MRVGTDIIFLPRLASLLRRRNPERFASRILCAEELTRWLSLPPSNQLERLRFLAVRWSVKEAAYKSLQPDLRLTWKHLSFLDDPTSASRKPALRLNQIDNGMRSGIKLHASVSHDGDYAIAMVVAVLDTA